MKHLFTITFLSALLLQSLNSKAQSVGAGMVYAAEFNELGIGVNGLFEISEELAISPSFFYYLAPQDFSYSEINGNVNYYFANEGVATFYGIGGLNFTTVAIDFNNEKTRNTELGLNIGIGTSLDLGSRFQPFGEAKYVLGNLDQLSLFFGARFAINQKTDQ